jgi:hypothetical protein
MPVQKFFVQAAATNHPSADAITHLPHPKMVCRILFLYSETFSNGIPATVQSWTHPFQGNVEEVLCQYIRTGADSLYARTLHIVQSSGMGKSRMVDQFSKKYFVIPLNLRDGDGKFYHPALVDSIALTLP